MVMLIFFIFATAFCSFSQQRKEKIIYLSDPSKNHFDTEYNAIDQCFKKGTQQKNINSFSLKFKLSATGKCRNGMLICYPGALDATGTKFANGMLPGIQFRVQNMPGNDVALKCAENRQSECKSVTVKDAKNRKMHCKNGAVWHGIRLTRPMDTKNEMHLEMSFTNKTYKFEIIKLEFTIELGNPNSLVTVLKDENGNAIKLTDDEQSAIQEAYMARTAEKVVHLSKYLGIWMLGLDILPMLNRETMQLHAYRHCDCEMHAWFLHPNEHPSRVSALSNFDYVPPIPYNCRTFAKNSELTVESALPANGTILRVKFRLNDEPRNLSVRLLNKKREFVMAITLNGKMVELSSKNSTEQMAFVMFSNRTLQQNIGRYMKIDFVVYAYLYEIRVNDTRNFRFFPWPNDWWMREAETGDIAIVELNGSLFPDSATVQIMEYTMDSRSEGSSSVNMDQPLFMGDTVTIRGKIHDDAQLLVILLLHGAYEVDENVGNAMMIMQINFTKNGENYVHAQHQQRDQNTWKNQLQNLAGLGKKTLPGRDEPLLRRGEVFEMRLFLTTEDKTKDNDSLIPASPKIIVSLSSYRANAKVAEYVLPGQFQIDNIAVKGDMTLFTTPNIIPGNLFLWDVTQIKWILIDPLLAKGDTVIFEGILKENAEGLRIIFIHGSMEPKLLTGTEIPFEIRFEFNPTHEKNFMFLCSKLTFGKKSTNITKSNSRIFAGQEFNVEILVKADKFDIHIHGAYVTSYEHKVPPWMVNYVRIDGDFKKIIDPKRKKGPTVSTDLNKSNSINSGLHWPIVLKIPNEKSFWPGNYAIIRGTVARLGNEQKLNISVAFLYDALENLETNYANMTKAGRLVLQLRFIGEKVVQYIERTDYNLPKIISSTNNSTLSSEQSFLLYIYFQKDQNFLVRLNNQILFNSSTTLPHWAIQYIKIEGDLNAQKTTVSIVSGGKNVLYKKV